MSDAVAADHRTSGPTPLSVGVIVWLSSELMFFAGLFAGWFALRASNEVWPPDDVHLDVPRTALATLALVASSATMHGAVVAARKADTTGVIRWLAATAGLGALFLVNLGLEYAELDFSISSHAYGSIFFLMTGFHGLHLAGGILFMVAVVGALAGKESQVPPEETVEVCGYYWHFVDVVWIAMFATVYLLG